MYEHANGSSDIMRCTFLAMASNELKVVLAQKDATIYFTKTHIADLRTVIQAETSDHSEHDIEGDQEKEAPPNAGQRLRRVRSDQAAFSLACGSDFRSVSPSEDCVDGFGQ